MRYWVIAIALVLLAGCGKKETTAERQPAPAGAPATASGTTPGASRSALAPPKRRRTPPRAIILPPNAVLPHKTTHHSKPPVDVAAKILGIGSYPGATLIGKPDDIDRTVNNGRETLKAFFTTPDQAGAVQDFYAKKLVKVDQHFTAGQVVHISGRTASGSTVIVSAVPDAAHPSRTQIQVLVVRPTKRK